MLSTQFGLSSSCSVKETRLVIFFHFVYTIWCKQLGFSSRHYNHYFHIITKYGLSNLCSRNSIDHIFICSILFGFIKFCLVQRTITTFLYSLHSLVKTSCVQFKKQYGPLFSFCLYYLVKAIILCSVQETITTFFILSTQFGLGNLGSVQETITTIFILSSLFDLSNFDQLQGIITTIISFSFCLNCLI